MPHLRPLARFGQTCPHAISLFRTENRLPGANSVNSRARFLARPRQRVFTWPNWRLITPERMPDPGPKVVRRDQRRNATKRHHHLHLGQELLAPRELLHRVLEAGKGRWITARTASAISGMMPTDWVRCRIVVSVTMICCRVCDI